MVVRDFRAMALVMIFFILPCSALQIPTNKPINMYTPKKSNTKSTIATHLAHGLATVTLAGSILFGPSSSSILPASAAAEPFSPSTTVVLSNNDPKAVKLNVDIKALYNALKSNRDELYLDVTSIEKVLSPTIRGTPPSNLKGALRDVLSGKASLVFNDNEELDVEVLESVEGALTVKLKSPLLPKIPFLASTTATAEEKPILSMPTVELPNVEDSVDSMVNAASDVPSIFQAFWDDAFFDGAVTLPFNPMEAKSSGPYVVSNKDVAGSTALGLGAVYGLSFAYYTALQQTSTKKPKPRKT